MSVCSKMPGLIEQSWMACKQCFLNTISMFWSIGMPSKFCECMTLQMMLKSTYDLPLGLIANVPSLQPPNCWWGGHYSPWKPLNRTMWYCALALFEVLSLPHMFWSVLISADWQENFSDQFWSESEFLLPQPFWLEINSAMAPLSISQHWSECSALNELISTECLKAEQTELSDAEQNWVLHQYYSCYYYNNKRSAWTGIEPQPP